MSQIPPPLHADERRRAHATTGAFIFQWWHSALAWLELGNDECLYVESSEDYETVSSGAGTTVQVSAGTSASFTLRYPKVIEALNNFWKLAEQDGRSIHFVLLAQAQVGREQGEGVGGNLSGIDLWMMVRTSPPGTELEKAEMLRCYLRDDPKVSLDLLPELQRFVREASAEEFRSRLVDRVTFDLGREPTGVVQQHVRDRLITFVDEKYGATVAEAEGLADTIFSRVARVAASQERLPLDRPGLLSLVEEKIIGYRRRMGLALPPRGFVTAEAGSNVVWEAPSDELALPRVPERILARPELVEKTCAQLMVGSALVLIGSTGMGKTTLAKLTAARAGGLWCWLDMQGCSSQAAQVAFRRILAMADRHRGQPLNIALDGFVVDDLTIRHAAR